MRVPITDDITGAGMGTALTTGDLSSLLPTWVTKFKITSFYLAPTIVDLTTHMVMNGYNVHVGLSHTDYRIENDLKVTKLVFPKEDQFGFWIEKNTSDLSKLIELDQTVIEAISDPGNWLLAVNILVS